MFWIFLLTTVSGGALSMHSVRLSSICARLKRSIMTLYALEVELSSTVNSVVCAAIWFVHNEVRLPMQGWVTILVCVLILRPSFLLAVFNIVLNRVSYVLSDHTEHLSQYSKRGMRTVLLI